MADDDDFIPSHASGLLRPLTTAAELPFVLGALAATLHARTAWTDEDPALVRTRVALERPRGDRVWVTFERAGREVPAREVLAGLKARGWDPASQGLSPWVERVRGDFAGSFAFDPAEVLRRALPHYGGFLHAWTDGRTARERLLHWPQRRQLELLHEYLAYADNDLENLARWGYPPDRALQDAADWLRTQRRFVLRWHVVLREEPEARGETVGALGARLLANAQALHDRLDGARDAELRAYLVELLTTDDARWPLGEVLERAELPRGRIALVRAWARLERLRHFEPRGEAQALQLALVDEVGRAQRWMW